MKKYIFSMLAGITGLLSFAQGNPQSCLMNAPHAPGKDTICTLTHAQKDAFRKIVADYDLMVEQKVNELKKEEKKDAATMEQQAKQKMMNDYGMSASDMQKLQSGKMTPEEKKAMADKMLQKNYGITVDEAKEVSQNGDAGKQAWAAQMQAQAAADPQTMGRNKSAYEILREKDSISNLLAAAETSIGEKFAQIEKDPQRIRMDRQIDSLRSEYFKLAGTYSESQARKMEEISRTVRSLQQTYCTQFASRYLDVLAEDLERVKKNLPDYSRLEELINLSNQVTTGTTVNMLHKDVMPFEAVRGYLAHLSGVFKYAKFDNDENFMTPAKED